MARHTQPRETEEEPEARPVTEVKEVLKDEGSAEGLSDDEVRAEQAQRALRGRKPQVQGPDIYEVTVPTS